jgi:hypothetical protein
MGAQAMGRKIIHNEDAHLLRESEAAYSVYFEAEKVDLSLENAVHFDINAEESA